MHTAVFVNLKCISILALHCLPTNILILNIILQRWSSHPIFSPFFIPFRFYLSNLCLHILQRFKSGHWPSRANRKVHRWQIESTVFIQQPTSWSREDKTLFSIQRAQDYISRARSSFIKSLSSRKDRGRKRERNSCAICLQHFVWRIVP